MVELQYNNWQMGMFDTIQCSDEMPYTNEMADLGLSVRDWSFQTKDLSNSMSEYVLQDGVLFEKKYKETKWIEPDPTDKLDFGHMEYNEPYLEDTKYHGKIRMYDYRHNVLKQWDCWIEYEVTFTDGKVVNKEIVEFRKESNAERLEQEKAWMEKITAEHNKWSNHYFFHTKPVMRVKRLIHKALYKVGNGIIKLSYRF